MKMNHRFAGVALASLLLLLWTTGAMGLSFTSSDVPKGIPDDGTVNSLIYVPPPTPGTAPLIVGSLTVTLDIKHTFNLDLDVYLYHQDLFTGKAVLVKLFSHVGGPLDDFPNISLATMPLRRSGMHRHLWPRTRRGNPKGICRTLPT